MKSPRIMGLITKSMVYPRMIDNIGYPRTKDYDFATSRKENSRTTKSNWQRVYQSVNQIEAFLDANLIDLLDVNLFKERYTFGLVDTNRKKRLNGKDLEIGKYYYIDYDNVDGFTRQKQVYIIRHIIKKEDFSCVVVKRAEGNNSTIFAIPPMVCKYLNIPFEDGLALMPYNANWKIFELEKPKVTQFAEFNPNDLSSYPYQNGFVNFIIVKLCGFQSLRCTHLVTSKGTTIEPEKFLKTLKVKLIYDLDGKKNKINIGNTVPYEIITDEIEQDTPQRRGCLCNTNGDLFIRVNLMNLGVTPSMLGGLKASDIFSFSWVEEDLDYDYPTPTSIERPSIPKDIDPSKTLIFADEEREIFSIYKDGMWQNLSKADWLRMRDSGNIRKVENYY